MQVIPVNINYLSSYRQWLAGQNVTGNTLRAYHCRIKQFITFLEYSDLYDQKLDDAAQLNEAIEAFTSFLKEAKAPPSSINAHLNALKSFSQFLGLEHVQLKRQPCPRKQAQALTPDEQAEFLSVVEQQELVRDRALAMVLFHAGLRIGDCARLNITDVATTHRHKMTGESTTATMSLTLGNGARAELNESTAHFLKLWLDERKHIPGCQNEPALWLTKDGQRLSISGIAFVVSRIGWQARLMVSAETLRRTWLVNATELFMDRGALASRLGGQVSQATLRRYGCLYRNESRGVSG